MLDPAHRPNSIPWPPLIVGGMVILALGLQWLVPLPWPSGPSRAALAVAGAVMAGAAIALDVAGIGAFRRHNTTVKPHAAATHLITGGSFGISRNPLYVANFLLVSGAGLLFGVPWLIAGALLAAVLTQELAIKREEKHLAARFGSDWNDYAARTPRWLFFR